MKICDGLIISAGYSSRMDGFKPLMRYNDMPFLFGIFLKMAQVCRKIVIVTGYRHEDIRHEIDCWLHRHPTSAMRELTGFSAADWHRLPGRLTYVYNPDYDSGMFSSLQAGMRHLPESGWILYHFVDQPHIPVSFYPAFGTAADENYDWIQPRYQDRSGHPILLNGKVRSRILSAGSDASLNSLSSAPEIRKKYWDCHHPQVCIDFDTRRDLSEAGEENGYL